LVSQLCAPADPDHGCVEAEAAGWRHSDQRIAASHEDLRSFVDALERRRQLLRIEPTVSFELEPTALCLHALRAEGPALLLLAAAPGPRALLGNLFGPRRRIELAMAGRPLASWH